MIEIDNIPKDLRIAIYGAGEVGLLVKHYIEANRPDLKIVCFFNKEAKVDFEGIPVYSIKKIQEFKSTFDLVIVASCSNVGIMETILRHYGVNNSIHLNNVFINEVDAAEDCTRVDASVKIVEIQEILSSDKSKKIFELIANAYKCKHCLKELADYLKEQNKMIYPKNHEQYLDFIDKASIKTIVSAGAYDAGTSLLFLDQLKNVEKIYAFEPMYDKFKCDINDSIVVESGKVEIIKKGVFDTTSEVSFYENDYASIISKPTDFLPYSTVVIQAVSIDDFVEENNINKIDFIKMDVEGCELPALRGAEKTIAAHRPQLAICIYHSYGELFEIPLYLKNLLEGYKFEVYHYSLNTIWESVLYAIPDELCQQDEMQASL